MVWAFVSLSGWTASAEALRVGRMPSQWRRVLVVDHEDGSAGQLMLKVQLSMMNCSVRSRSDATASTFERRADCKNPTTPHSERVDDGHKLRANWRSMETGEQINRDVD